MHDREVNHTTGDSVNDERVYVTCRYIPPKGVRRKAKSTSFTANGTRDPIEMADRIQKLLGEPASPNGEPHMAVTLRNTHLEQQLAKEAERRGYKSMARAVEDLLTERLRDLHHERRDQGKQQPATAGA